MKKLTALFTAIVLVFSLALMTSAAETSNIDILVDSSHDSRIAALNESDESITYTPRNDNTIIMPFADYSIEWTLSAGATGRGASSFTMDSSMSIYVNATSDPAVNVSYGLYNTSTKVYSWGLTSKTGINGYLTPNQSGVYSLAVKNNSTGSITITGSYSV